MTEPMPLLLLATLAVALAAIAIFVVKRRARRAALDEPFPAAWRRMLAARVPLHARVPAELHVRLERETRRFLQQVRFVGCGGLEITDEMRLVIAWQASLLTVNRDAGGFEGLFSVLVYPDEFVVEESIEDEAGVVTEGSRALSGQAIETDRIVLSWRDVLESGEEDDAYNVVLHEFAHYLDHAFGGARWDSWRRVLEHEYRELCAAVERDEETLIDPYGAEDPAEFFAVVTETFLELPREMEQRHAPLYVELKRFYGLDPARW